MRVQSASAIIIRRILRESRFLPGRFARVLMPLLNRAFVSAGALKNVFGSFSLYIYAFFLSGE